MKPRGVKIVTEEAEKDVTFLMDVDPMYVSLVKHGANQQPFRVIKEDKDGGEQSVLSPLPKTVGFIDTNLGIDHALACVDTFKTFFFIDGGGGFPAIQDHCSGEGFPGLIKVRDMGGVLDKDFIVVTDCYYGSLADRQRKKGKKIFGPSEEWTRIENDRVYGWKRLKEMGVGVPAGQIVHGMKELLSYIRDNQDGKKVFFLKVSEYRGNRETGSGVRNETEAMTSITQAGFGPYLTDLEILVQDACPGLELGFDAYFNGREFIRPFLYTIEEKGAGTVGVWTEGNGIEEYIFNKIKPSLIETNYRGNVSFEFFYDGKKVYCHDPTCVYQTNEVMTEKGWTQIRNIQIGDRVLTHKGRFRKVLSTKKDTKVERIKIYTQGNSDKPLMVTPEHLVLTDNGWRQAGLIQVGDKILALSEQCEWCGASINSFKGRINRFCSQSCRTSFANDQRKVKGTHEDYLKKLGAGRKKAWDSVSLEERKRICNRGLKKMLRWRKDNPELAKERDREAGEKNRTSVKLAYQKDPTYKLRVLAGGKRWREGLSKAEKAKRKNMAIEALHKARQVVQEMKQNDPDAYTALQKKIGEAISRTKKRQFVENPERFQAIRNRQTSIEIAVGKELKRRLVDFEANPCLTLVDIDGGPVVLSPDVLLPDYNLIIECDGDYWHSFERRKVRDDYRDLVFESNGYTVLHLTESDINTDVRECGDRIDRMVSNHSGKLVARMQYVGVTRVERKKLLRPRSVIDLRVEDDETFVVRGLTVHNCRLPFPCSSIQAHVEKNHPEVLYRVAAGEDVRVQIGKKYVAQVGVYTEEEMTWRPILFPSEFRPNIGFRRIVIRDDEFYFVPGDSVVATIVGEGDTAEEAMQNAMDIALQVECSNTYIPADFVNITMEKIGKLNLLGEDMQF